MFVLSQEKGVLGMCHCDPPSPDPELPLVQLGPPTPILPRTPPTAILVGHAGVTSTPLDICASGSKLHSGDMAFVLPERNLC